MGTETTAEREDADYVRQILGSTGIWLSHRREERNETRGGRQPVGMYPLHCLGPRISDTHEGSSNFQDSVRIRPHTAKLSTGLSV